MPNPAAVQVTEVLADAYGLIGARLARLDGQVSINYRATTAEGRRVFVKNYTCGSDLAAEEEAIAQTRLAGDHGVPVAAIVPSVTGELITRRGDTAVSVWEWLPGHSVESGFNAVQQVATGRMLGRVHRAFAGHPTGTHPSPRVDRWLNPDLDKCDATIDTLLALIKDRTEQEPFDRQAADTLTERRTQLLRLPSLITALPPLHAQVLHGDYSPKNLLFHGNAITAVVDFGPAEPFLTSYELGRIAFDPRSVALGEDWIASGMALVAAYLEENPHLPAADITSCARVALIQLMVSLYGVKEHYLKPGLIQDDLDRFWLLRHRAATRLLDHLDEVEEALASVTPSSSMHRRSAS
ncbi:phosphotransferase enzyme family protein [Sphaerimonospora thailandensis]|uniref:Aminoglycoside phosphotransferase domain-containing protein n=1 Tax=Sphaerimonospora thailandensis TaxID=795644 RepID=A0A8J3RAZ5_9ACTN|nr:phosphotransferase [Sphaerimonospora thailandensis]GIH71708.1 hypothetical protein Mth01_39610 [Sphaerimonospora thailandensis]